MGQGLSSSAMRHVERSQADDVAQTGDDKNCTGAWDTAEEAAEEAGGGEGGTGMKPTVQLVSQIVEKQKVRPRKHHISSRIEYAVKSLAHLKMLTHHAG